MNTSGTPPTLRHHLLMVVLFSFLAGAGVFFLFRYSAASTMGIMEEEIKVRLRQTLSLAYNTVAPALESLDRGNADKESVMAGVVATMSTMAFDVGGKYDAVRMVGYDGTLYSDPTNPELVGRNFGGVSSANGTELFAEAMDLVRERGRGFLRVEMVGGETGESVPMLSYFRDLPGLDSFIIVGVRADRLDAQRAVLMRQAYWASILAFVLGLGPVSAVARLIHSRQRVLDSEVSERRRIQSMFRSSESRLKAVFEAATDVAFVLADRDGPTGRIVEFSPGAERIFGYMSREVKGRELAMLFSRTDAKVLAAGMNDIAMGWGLPGRERMMVRRDGDVFPALCGVHPILDQDRKVTGVLAACVDISERKHSESITYLLYRIANLVGTTRDLDHLYESIHHVIREVLDVKNFFIALLDREKDRLLFPYFKDERHGGVFEIPDVSTLDPPSLSVHVLRTGKPLILTKEQKTRSDYKIRPIGPMSQIWLGVPLILNGEVVGVMGVQDYDDPDAFSSADVDLVVAVSHQVGLAIERKRNEEALNRARYEAEAASRSKSEFLANMSHEIRTPLNGILGMAELTLATELNAEQRENMEMLRDSGQALLRLLNDILDISKIEAGKMELVSERFDLHALMESVANMFAVQVRNKGISLEWAMDERVPHHVFGDAGRLRQVLVNLVGNAVKFTESGGVDIQLTPHVGVFPWTDLRPGAPMACRFEVRDTGCGISADKLDKIFDSFTQADGSLRRRYQGAGLGLAISRRLAEMMGGGIIADSEPGAGATFEFTAILHVSEPPEASLDEEMGVRSIPKRVLLAEDNMVNMLYAERVLQQAGHEVVSTRTGSGAIEALRADGFDVVIMDIQMPDMDGLEATRRIRAGEAGESVADVPIVAMTAHAMKGDRERFMEAGMNAYIAKPMDPDQLADVLSGLYG